MASDTPEHNFDENILDLQENELLLPVYTIPLHEGKFCSFCEQNGITHYLPLRKTWKITHQVHGEKTYQYSRIVFRPMFPSYVFAKLNLEQRSFIFTSKCLTRIIRVDPTGMDRIIREVRTIRQVEQIALSEEIDFNAHIKEGERFVIESGIWEGCYGWLKKKNKRFVWTVEFESVNGIIAATIDPSKFKMSKA